MATPLHAQISELKRGCLRPAAPRQLHLRPAPTHLHAALGAQVAATAHGELLVWEKSISELWSRGSAIARNLWLALDRAGPPSPAAPTIAPLRAAKPSGIAWLDIETAGFMGRPIFLVGMMRPRDDDVVITQLLAADYSQERALLARCAQALAESQVLVTFNGKCFDVPMLRDRMAYHRVRETVELDHVDLLHLARRRWRGRLPDCRLQTLERRLCRRMRSGDIPSALIPQRYHEFVRTQDASLIAPVMRHNRLDLLTMAELSGMLLGDEGRSASAAPE
jgi:uncharacterized protein YprB with RNaseH-like and TPR domain